MEEKATMSAILDQLQLLNARTSDIWQATAGVQRMPDNFQLNVALVRFYSEAADRLSDACRRAERRLYDEQTVESLEMTKQELAKEQDNLLQCWQIVTTINITCEL